MAKIEQKINENVHKKMDEIIVQTKRQLREVKNVLRTPRLYDYFRSYLTLADKKDTLKSYIKSQLDAQEHNDQVFQIDDAQISIFDGLDK